MLESATLGSIRLFNLFNDSYYYLNCIKPCPKVLFEYPVFRHTIAIFDSELGIKEE